MKPKKYNKNAQPEQVDHYGPTGPILSGDANFRKPSWIWW